MRNLCLSITIALGAIGTSTLAAENTPITTGVANFSSCFTGSKYGKKEQANFENLRKQLVSLVENTEKQLKETAAKLEDTEYLDSLSPKAEEDLKRKYQELSDNLAQHQQQFYHILNQANSQLIQKMIQHVSRASEKVAEKINLNCVINQEACFYSRENLNVTKQVIEQMDFDFSEAVKNKKVSENGEIEFDDSLTDFPDLSESLSLPYSSPFSDSMNE